MIAITQRSGLTGILHFTKKKQVAVSWWQSDGQHIKSTYQETLLYLQSKF
jgi:hypothetical protein